MQSVSLHPKVGSLTKAGKVKISVIEADRPSPAIKPVPNDRDVKVNCPSGVVAKRFTLEMSVSTKLSPAFLLISKVPTTVKSLAAAGLIVMLASLLFHPKLKLIAWTGTETRDDKATNPVTARILRNMGGGKIGHLY